MINKNHYEKIPNHIDYVLEIRLCLESWYKIQYVARLRNKSYSWVVRYALFRLIKRKELNKYLSHDMLPPYGRNSFTSEKFRRHNENAWNRRADSKGKHRHRLCLYGEDELYIRLAAARLRCSITHLVRLALEVYLDRLVSHIRARLHSRVARGWFFHDYFWYWLGIKLYQDVEFHTFSPESILFKFTPYKKYAYF